MAERIGKYTLKFGSRPGIIASAAIVGSKEGDGPLGGNFDEIITDGTFGEKTWEKAESAFQHRAVVKAIEKSGMTAADIDMLMAGDLLSQCSGSAFGARDLGIPFVGLYGACSTMALSLALAALSVDSGAARIAAAATSSHFCSAEKQFRTPLEYGGQRPPTAQWTATAAGCAVIGKSASPHIEAATFGRITDYGVKDANNMGAAMAPAACSTITAFLQDTKTQPEDLDLILTGDLGYVGSTLLRELMRKQEHIDPPQRLRTDALSAQRAGCELRRLGLRVQRGGCLLAYRQRDALGQAQQSALRRNGRAALGSLTAPGRDSAVDSPRGPADKLKGDSNGYCAECFKEPEARQLRTDLDALARYNQKAYRRRGDSDSRLLGAEHNSRVQG